MTRSSSARSPRSEPTSGIFRQSVWRFLIPMSRMAPRREWRPLLRLVCVAIIGPLLALLVSNPGPRRWVLFDGVGKPVDRGLALGDDLFTVFLGELAGHQVPGLGIAVCRPVRHELLFRAEIRLPVDVGHGNL